MVVFHGRMSMHARGTVWHRAEHSSEEKKHENIYELTCCHTYNGKIFMFLFTGKCSEFILVLS